MHDSAGEKGKSPGDHNATEIDAEHGGAMAADLVRACRAQRAVNAEKCQRNEEMNRAESEKCSLRHERVNPQRRDSRDCHERQIDIAKSAMPPRALATDEDEVGADRRGRDDCCDVEDDRR